MPVTGTVTAGNLPLDANGNVRTSVAPATTKYQFKTLLIYQCSLVNGVPDLCVTGTGESVETVLDSYSTQGYELFAIVPYSPGGGGCVNCGMAYTLRAPVP